MTYHPRTTTASARYWTGLVALFPSSAWLFLMVWAVLPALLLGWEPVAITSDSMAPRINRGDVMLAAAPGDAVLGPGNVVVFSDPARPGRVTHRILAITPDGDYVTKGDGNERRDSTPISPSAVVGVGRVLVPIVGLVLVWLGEGQILLFATTVLVLGALAWWSRWAFIYTPPRRHRRPPPTLGSPDGQDATPEPEVSPPVRAGRNRAVLLMRAVFVVIGLLWANRRPPRTLGSPSGHDATPEPQVSPPVRAGRNRAVFLIGAVFVVRGLLWANRRPPPTLGSPGGQDATPEPEVSPPVRAGRNRAIFLIGAVFVVIGLLLATGFSRSQVSESTDNTGNTVTAASSFGASVFYLHNDPTPPTGDTASHAVLPFDGTVPTASVLYNYDSDRDSDDGLVLAKSGPGLSETDLTKYQIWSVLGPINLNGSTTLTLWSAIKSFDTTKRGVVLAALLDCAVDGSDCNTITTGSLDHNPWDSAGSGTWVEKTMDLGAVTYTIAADRTLRVKIVVRANSGDNMWFAYDTTSYDSHLQFGP